jgi:hypothetical protein
VLVIVVAAVAAIVVAAVAIVLIRAFVRVAAPGGTGGPSHRVTGTANGRDAATLDLVSGVSSVSIRAEDLGPDMYRVSTPADGALLPKVVDRDERVEVQLTESGERGASSVLIELDPAVAWRIRIGGGANEVLIAMGSGGFAGLDLATGVTTVDATVPKPSGTVTIRIGGGVNLFTLHRPDGIPARVNVGAGAGEIRLDGESNRGVSAGTARTTAGWESATDRYDIDAATGVSTVVID